MAFSLHAAQYSIHRGRLLGVLHRTFAAGWARPFLRTSHRVARYHQDEQSVTAVLDNGRTVEGDLLVGADGVSTGIPWPVGQTRDPVQAKNCGSVVARTRLSYDIASFERRGS